MTSRHSNLALLVAVFASIVAHALVMWPWLRAVLEAQPTHPAARPARFDEEKLERRPLDDPMLALGLDMPSPSTLTWIGYETYVEHMAMLADSEQAAFETTPRGEQIITAVLPDSPVPSVQPLDEAPPPRPRQETTPRKIPGELLPPSRTDGGPKDRGEQPTHTKNDKPAAPDAKPKPPTPNPEAPKPRGDQPKAADLAEQESDPTSDMPWEKIALGKPLAAQGLTLKPRKPVFTTWIRITASPRNPHVEIQFDRRGVPSRASITESSGDGRVDEAILNSLYRWRAAGAKLAELAPAQTFTVRLRIVIRPDPE